LARRFGKVVHDESEANATGKGVGGGFVDRGG
jgi:hypothetical protein